jgi:hypothetical protein
MNMSDGESQVHLASLSGRAAPWIQSHVVGPSAFASIEGSSAGHDKQSFSVLPGFLDDAKPWINPNAEPPPSAYCVQDEQDEWQVSLQYGPVFPFTQALHLPLALSQPPTQCSGHCMVQMSPKKISSHPLLQMPSSLHSLSRQPDGQEAQTLFLT